MRQCESIIKLEHPLGVMSQTLVNLSSFQNITRLWRREAVDRIGCRVQTDDHRWYGVCVWPFRIRHMLFNTTSSTLYFVTSFGLCLSRPWGYSEVSFGINKELYMLPELSGKTAPALYLKLKINDIWKQFNCSCSQLHCWWHSRCLSARSSIRHIGYSCRVWRIYHTCFSKKSDGKGYLHYRSGRGARLRWVWRDGRSRRCISEGMGKYNYVLVRLIFNLNYIEND